MSSAVTAEHNECENISSRYAQLHEDVFVSTKTHASAVQQASVLETTHQSTKYEYLIQQAMPLTEDIAQISPEPEYKLMHGLPGSRKSLMFKWLRSYVDNWIMVRDL